MASVNETFLHIILQREELWKKSVINKPEILLRQSVQQ